MIGRKIKYIIIALIVLIVSYLVYLHLYDKKLEDYNLGVLYTSACSIGNIKEEYPENFNTLEKQFKYCDTLNKKQKHGYYFYDFTTNEHLYLSETFLNNALDHLSLPTNIVSKVSYQDDNFEGTQFNKYIEDEEVEIYEDTFIKCERESGNTSTNQIMCKITKIIENEKTIGEYVKIKTRGELLLPSLFLKGSDFYKTRSVLLYCHKYKYRISKLTNIVDGNLFNNLSTCRNLVY